MTRKLRLIPILLAFGLSACLSGMVGAATPTPSVEQALRFAPIQPGIDYDKPAEAEIAKCTIRAEKLDGETAWVVRGDSGQILRKFSDSNSDNVVDRWSYYRGELEVYRDIDSNHNGKADQSRWFHTAGARWGIDTNEDGKVDQWRFISAEEVAAELIESLRGRDAGRFTALLVTNEELTNLGLGKEQADEIRAKVAAAAKSFATFAADQKTVGPKTRFLSFGGTQPGLVPAGVHGAERDFLVYENVAALVEIEGKSQHVSIGTIVRVGDVWRLIDIPQVDNDSNETENGFFFRSEPRRAGDQATPVASGPSEETQKMMTALEELDRKIATATPDDQAKLNARRCDLLESLAAAAKDPVEREQWIRNLGDTVGAAAQVGSFPEGIDRLKHLEESLAKNKEDDSLFAFIQYRRMQAEYSVEIQSPKADPQKIQQAWLEKLETFVKDHPAASDASEAMLQIAIANEFAGEDEAAEKWYTRLVKDFPESNAGKKGAGALRRLGSVGKVLPLKGTTMLGNKVALSQYKGQMVLIQYWATWCEPCLKDMDEIKELQAKYAKQFAVLGVNLDNDAEQAKRFAKSEKLPWHNLYEPGGLDSRLAVEMGILTLPTLILVDEKGQVINRNIHAGELAGELRKLNVADQRRALK